MSDYNFAQARKNWGDNTVVRCANCAELEARVKELEGELGEWNFVQNELRDKLAAHQAALKVATDALEAIDKAAKFNQSTWGHWIKKQCEEVLAKIKELTK